jgi:hypothetical protein
MTLHQINADGAGPMTCAVSADATGATFTAMTITTDVPGTNGKSNAANQDFPLIASMPAGTACTGTVGALTAVCAVKCANVVGPFGKFVKATLPSTLTMVQVLLYLYNKAEQVEQ